MQTDMLINVIKLETPKYKSTHLRKHDFFKIKKPEIHSRQKECSTDDVGQIDGCIQKKAKKKSILITLQKTKLQLDQRLKHQIRYTEANGRNLGNGFELTGTGKSLSEQNTISTGTKTSN